MTSVYLSLIGLAVAIVNAGGFTILGLSHAKERSRLMDAALSGSAAEFALRQRASQKPSKASTAPPERTPPPDGL